MESASAISRAETETVFMVLVQHRVLLRDNRRRVVRLPAGFYSSVVAHVSDKSSKEVLSAHIIEGLTYHDLPINEARVHAATNDLIYYGQDWTQKNRVRERGGAIQEWTRLQVRHQEHFRRVIESDPQINYSRVENVTAEYERVGDGQAFHNQYAGWREAAQVIYNRIVQTLSPDRGRNAEEAEIHRNYEILVRGQLAYPFLASWRLCIECLLKETLVQVRAAPGQINTEGSSRILLHHSLEPIWIELQSRLPALKASALDVCKGIGANVDNIEAIIDSTPFSIIVNELIDIDSDGQQLRYQTNRSGEYNLGRIHRIELGRLQVEIEALESYLRGIELLASSLSSQDKCKSTINALQAGEPLYPSDWL